MNSGKTVLILGANGRFGASAATAFADAGWRVLAQMRRAAIDCDPRIKVVRVELEDTDALASVAKGARVVVHGINPDYTRWAEQMLPLACKGMRLAQRLDALFMLPGNVYAYGRSMPSRLAPDTPTMPDTRKGRLRAALELEMASRVESGLRSVVIRAGDFYGRGTGSWLDIAIVKSLKSGKLVYPGPLDVFHAWAFLPDLARAFVQVAERDVPDGFTNLHFEGHTLTGAELLAALEIAAAQVGIEPERGRWRHGRFPWQLLRLGGIIVPLWREVAELRYLWTQPHALDGAALRAVAGPLPSTPLVSALVASLHGLGIAGASGGR
jgi:nucleoside-diphosphate-sugar epimerase